VRLAVDQRQAGDDGPCAPQDHNPQQHQLGCPVRAAAGPAPVCQPVSEEPEDEYDPVGGVERQGRGRARGAVVHGQAGARHGLLARHAGRATCGVGRNSQASAIVRVAARPGCGRRTGRRSRVPAYAEPAAAAPCTVGGPILAIAL
jgi:hypothetical protein